MNEKILLIDDDEALLRVLATVLKQENFQVFTAKNGTEGLRTAFLTQPDLVILDIEMPGLDGLDVTQRLLELAEIPIIILTGHTGTSDLIKALSAGVDDYMLKPYNREELLARVRHTLRRKASSSPALSSVIQIGQDGVIDLMRRKVTIGGKQVLLTPTEFRLLSYLARNRGRVIPHRTLLIEIWGSDYSNEIEYLHLYVRYLRRKIERDPAHPELIKTERSVGYYLDD